MNRGGETKTRTISVVVPVDLHRELRLEAVRRYSSVSQVIRDYLAEARREREDRRGRGPVGQGKESIE